MSYKVSIFYDAESESWQALGEYGTRFLNMEARSLDVLIERSNLALSDLMETNEFKVEYVMNQEMDVSYA